MKSYPDDRCIDRFCVWSCGPVIGSGSVLGGLQKGSSVVILDVPKITEEHLTLLSKEEKERLFFCSHEWNEMFPWHPIYLGSEEDGVTVSELVERNFRCDRCGFLLNQVERIDGSGH